MTDLDAGRIAADLERLQAHLGPVTVLGTTGSTNDEARALAAAGAPHGAVVLADSQTAGRGRGAHRWHSPPGESLYLSLVWRPALEPSRLALLALAVGVGVARAVDAHLDVPRAAIKWPNDVYVDDRKLAGILVEASLSARSALAIVGVGLNVATLSFPTELADTATSLALCGGHDLERSAMAADVLASIAAACRALEAGGGDAIVRELARRDWLRGRAVEAGDVAGVAVGIDAEGRLLVRTPGGATHVVVSGEVTLRVVRPA